MKKCTKCSIEKDESEFYQRKNSKDGLRDWCKQCEKEYNSKWYKANPEKSKENRENFRKHNPNYSKEYNEINKEKRLQHKKEYYQNNKEKYRQYNRSEQRKINRNIHNKTRRKKDPAFVLICGLRKRTGEALKGQRKTISTKDGIGCSLEYLVKHIESQFDEKMSWLNYGNKEGQWSVDHVHPFFMCNQDDPDEIVRNNHYMNLRPMWHKDNMSRRYDEFKENDKN